MRVYCSRQRPRFNDNSNAYIRVEVEWKGSKFEHFSWSVNAARYVCFVDKAVVGSGKMRVERRGGLAKPERLIERLDG